METVEVTKVNISFSTLHWMFSHFSPLITNLSPWGLKIPHSLHFLLWCLHLILHLYASYQHCITCPGVFRVKFLLFSFTSKAIHDWPTISFSLALESPNPFGKGPEGNVLGLRNPTVSVTMTHFSLCSWKIANIVNKLNVNKWVRLCSHKTLFTSSNNKKAVGGL